MIPNDFVDGSRPSKFSLFMSVANVTLSGPDKDETTPQNEILVNKKPSEKEETDSLALAILAQSTVPFVIILLAILFVWKRRRDKKLRKQSMGEKEDVEEKGEEESEGSEESLDEKDSDPGEGEAEDKENEDKEGDQDQDSSGNEEEEEDNDAGRPSKRSIV